MPFDEETEEKIRLDKEEAKKRWDAMTPEEREELRKISLRFSKKVDSCYPQVSHNKAQTNENEPI